MIEHHLTVFKGFAFANRLRLERTVTPNYVVAAGNHSASFEVLDAAGVVVITTAMTVQLSTLETYEGRTIHAFEASLLISSANLATLTVHETYRYQAKLTDSQNTPVLMAFGRLYVRQV